MYVKDLLKFIPEEHSNNHQNIGFRCELIET
jgi:hypothetical protein